MSAFSDRAGGYRLGLVGLWLFTGLYVVGFGAPYWGRVKGGQGVSLGLWMACATDGPDSCASMGVSDVVLWFTFVRILQSTGLAFLLIACLYGMSVNCCRSVSGPFSRALEKWAGLGALFGLCGDAVFFVRSADELTFSWALYASTAAGAGALLSTILVGASNKPPATTAAAAAPARGEAIAMGPLPPPPPPPPQQQQQLRLGGAGVPSGVTPSAPYPDLQSYGPSAPVYHVPTRPEYGGYPPSYYPVSYPSAPPR